MISPLVSPLKYCTQSDSSGVQCTHIHIYGTVHTLHLTSATREFRNSSVTDDDKRNELLSTIPNRLAELSCVGHSRNISASSHLETVRSPSTTGLLEFTSLRFDSGLDAVVSVGIVNRGAVTEVLNALTSVLRTSQQHDSRAGRASKSELVEGQALTTSLDNPSASSLSKSKSADGESGHFEETDVVGNSPDNDGSFLLLAPHVSRKTGQGQRRSVDPRHPQSLGNGRGKLRAGPSR